ncbi:MAG TPA: hypothetical protein VL360_06660 [Gammaproteobacteria bacterium]|jgi:hypothetical protein|nr:hypothetical protein [Gammaproteobacteria bacterium]
MKVTGKQIVALLVSIMVIVISEAGWAAAGDATSISKPPLFNDTQRTNAPQKSVQSGPTSTTISNEGYSTTITLVCPTDTTHCPDINNKCHAPDGICPDLKLGQSDPNYNLCPETCTVTRQTSGTNPYVNDMYGNPLPLSDIPAICPSGYVQLGAYNLQPEYKAATAPVQMPWPITGVYANSYVSNFNDTTNFKCGVVSQYTSVFCSQVSPMSPPQNATPLNGTLATTYTSNYGSISLSLDYGYTNYGADTSAAPSVGATCYNNVGCTTLDYDNAYFCTSWFPQGPPGCNAANNNGYLSCLNGNQIYSGGNCTSPSGWCCPTCHSTSMRKITRTVYPNICWYKGGKLAPGSGLVPATVVCGRVKQSWR